MPLLRLLERWNSLDEIRRYFRDEHLAEDLELHLARERGQASNLERSLYAARSYFAS